MRGRTLFHMSKPVLGGGAWVLRLVPYGLCAGLLALVRHVPTRLGVAVRYILIRRMAKRCGDCVAIFEGVYLHALHEAEFGDHISIHPMCYIDARGGLKFGSDVSIAHAATIMTTEHDFTAAEVATRDAPLRPARVEIGDDVWIGCGVRILAGASIGDRTVVGAGAVVTRPVEADTLAAGVPARSIKSIKRAA
jgi:acetyltransferase-like isoleucine patch superfamily enzyme